MARVIDLNNIHANHDNNNYDKKSRKTLKGPMSKTTINNKEIGWHPKR